MAIPLLESTSARAAPAVPKRLVIYATPEGNLSTLFKPPTLAGDALSLSPMLAPLASHADKLVVVSGVSNAIAPLHPAADGHTKTGKTLMAATVIASSADGLSYDPARAPTYGQCTLGPSIDHALAAKLGVPLPLNIALGTSDPGENTMFYRTGAPGSSGPCPVAPLSLDPRRVFDENLAGVMGSTATTRRERFLERRSAAVHAAREAFSTLRGRVSAADRLRLEAHVDALADLEARVHFAPPMACAGGPAPAGYTLPSTENGWRGLDTMADLHLDLMVRILACDARRIVTLQDTMFDAPPFEFLPSGGIAGWHVEVHNNWDNHNPENLKESFQYFAGVFAKLLSKMDSIIEPNGMSLLDNSVVLWISEFGNGGLHDANNLPVVLAGGGQGAFALHRHLDRPGATTNDLFVSLLQAFGLPDTRFGFDSADLNHGGIAGFLA
ncbi:MAG: DUF1552 domain-containing protein [Myxococcota bacterium]